MRRLLSILRKTPFQTLQVLSDLHLEIGKQYASYQVPVKAPFLILAGDVGRLSDYTEYRDFLRRLTEGFELIFLILGNQEFYNSTYALAIDKARELVQEDGLKDKVILLHRSSFDLPNSDITILGCTLWSAIPDLERNVVKKSIKDFRRILNWTVDDHHAIHETELDWLKHEVTAICERDPTRRIIIVTHHAPDREICLTKALLNRPASSAFATDLLDDMSEWTGVAMWIFGHTHLTTDAKKGETRLVANQRGFMIEEQQHGGRRTNDEFDVSRVVRI